MTSMGSAGFREAKAAWLRVESGVAYVRALLLGQRWIEALAREEKYRPDQPRVPAGNADGGQWTDGGGVVSGSEGQNSLVGGGEQSGYPIDLLEEEAEGGHTFERHVGKTEQYLIARVAGSRVNIPFIGTLGERRAGSFVSLEAAAKLVNSTLSDPLNRAKVDAFVRGDFLYSLPVLYLFKDFESRTGYEAYTRGDRQPQIRSTYSVRVRLVRRAAIPKGYMVDSAWPENND